MHMNANQRALASLLSAPLCSDRLVSWLIVSKLVSEGVRERVNELGEHKTKDMSNNRYMNSNSTT